MAVLAGPGREVRGVVFRLRKRNKRSESTGRHGQHGEGTNYCSGRVGVATVRFRALNNPSLFYPKSRSWAHAGVLFFWHECWAGERGGR